MSRTDTVSLLGMRVRGHHGVLAREREDGQDFLVDAVLEFDTAPAAERDDLARTVDYGVLAQKLAAVVAGQAVDLIETLAERLVAVCLADPLVSAATVTVHKPGAPIPVVPVPLTFGDVCVTIRRERH